MARRKRREDNGDPRVKDLDVFLNQPNINMVVPWIYEIANTMKSRSRDGESEEEEGGQEDEVAKDLECFLNQPNINMTIPWIYQIYKSVKSGGGDGGGSGEDSGLEWDDRDL